MSKDEIQKVTLGTNEALRVTADGEFIWHPEADAMIEYGDFTSSPAMRHILRALRKALAASVPWLEMEGCQMITEKALKLALEALECLKRDFDADQFEWEIADVAITAIKQARSAPDLQAELDATNRQVEILSDALAESRREVAALKAVQEPVAFFDPQGKGFYWAKPTKITAPVTVDVEPLPLYTTPPAAPVQEPVFCEYCGGNDDADFGLPTDHCTDCARPQPAAQRQLVELTEDEIDEIFNNWPTYNLDHFEFGKVVEAKVFEKNGAIAVVIPDALNPKDENPAYAAGWNDCRAEMLKGMKP
jgi:hypothetical protein